MDHLIIQGPAKLEGEVSISTAKNACLPILSAVLLSEGKVTLESLPSLRDIRTMKRLLSNLGVEIEEQGKNSIFDVSKLNNFEATYDLVKTMRASIFVLGPLLARMGEAKVSLPGGCAIGTRPIDIHLNGLKKLGAEIKLEGGYVHAKADKLIGAHIVLPFPSVGATENIMMAATRAEGESIIENAAKEPEIDDLGNFLNAMGAEVSGLGTSKLIIKGHPEKFKDISYRPIADRIEAGTYIMAALMTKSEITVKDFSPSHIDFVLKKLEDLGAKFEIGEDYVKVFESELEGGKIDTAPYPGFPTDLQAQMMSLCLVANGASIITEHIFENRFMHVPELQRLGAKIALEGHTAFVKGGHKLSGAPLMCTDLRASAALVMAALASEGKTIIDRVYHLDRGYENLDTKLKGLGVQIERVNNG